MWMDLFQGKTGTCAFLAVLSVLSREGIVVASAFVPFNNCSIICYSLIALMSTSLWLSELDVLRTCTMGGSLKCWGTKCGLQAPHSSGKSWESGVPSWLYDTVWSYGVYGESVSQPFLSLPMWVFSRLLNV